MENEQDEDVKVISAATYLDLAVEPLKEKIQIRENEEKKVTVMLLQWRWEKLSLLQQN